MIILSMIILLSEFRYGIWNKAEAPASHLIDVLVDGLILCFDFMYFNE